MDNATTPETKVEKLERLLVRHDWWYNMSDDARVWRAGLASAERIEALAAQLGEVGARMVQEHAARVFVSNPNDPRKN